MKTIALCAGCGAVAFLAISYQMGLFEEPAWPDGEAAQAAAEVSATQSKRLDLPRPRREAAQAAAEVSATARPSFPEDLAPACSGKPVAEARAYRAASEPHPLAFFDGSGKLHAAWQQRLGEECPRSAIANFRNNLPPACQGPRQNGPMHPGIWRSGRLVGTSHWRA